jgi:hypothetical protein
VDGLDENAADLKLIAVLEKMGLADPLATDTSSPPAFRREVEENFRILCKFARHWQIRMDMSRHADVEIILGRQSLIAINVTFRSISKASPSAGNRPDKRSGRDRDEDLFRSIGKLFRPARDALVPWHSCQQHAHATEITPAKTSPAPTKPDNAIQPGCTK